MNRYVLLTTVSLVLGATTGALAQGTAFTYQGRLNDGASPANGNFDLRFSIFNALSDGTQLGAAVMTNAISVTNGLFTVTLDFGNQFPGAGRWLEIAVRTNGGGAFDTLTPRQALTATPYAITAGGVTGPINGSLITAGTVADAGLSTNVALRSGGNIFSGVQTFNDVLTANGRYSGRGDIRLYAFDGNGSNGAAFLQARDSSGSSSIDLVLRSQLAGSLIDAVNVKSNGNVGIGTASPGQLLQVGSASTANSQGMIALASRSGTGVAARTWELGVPETDEDTSGTGYSFVINDTGNGTTPEFMVKFGTGNVGIGTTNPAAKLDVNGTIQATGFSGSGAALTGLDASSLSSGTIPNGRLSANVSLLGQTIESSEITDGTIVNADINAAAAIADTKLATISTAGKVADSALSTNIARRSGANTFSGAQTFSGPLTANDTFSGFGDFRLYAYDGNGSNGTAFIQARDDSGSSTIDLVLRSQAAGSLVDAVRIKGNGLVGIGTNSSFATLHVRSKFTNAPALRIDTSSGDQALVVDRFGAVDINGAFSTKSNAIVAGEITTTAINLTSDRNAKEDFRPVNPLEVLEKVARLPISEWQYKTTDNRASDGARHIGPMAQDFREAFALGRDDKHITSVDADGVALAAIQGLNAKLEEKTREVESLRQSVAELRELVSRLTQPVNR